MSNYSDAKGREPVVWEFDRSLVRLSGPSMMPLTAEVLARAVFKAENGLERLKVEDHYWGKFVIRTPGFMATDAMRAAAERERPRNGVVEFSASIRD